jgi:hypothetical protein
VATAMMAPSFERIFLTTQLSKSHHQNKLKFVWAGGPELKPLNQKQLKRCTNFAKRKHKGQSSITGKALHKASIKASNTHNESLHTW